VIISELTGGLGNQMFQYAFGYSQAKKLGVDFKYNFISHHGDTPRTFELDCFNISANQATPHDMRKFSTGAIIFSRMLGRFMKQKNLICNEQDDGIDLKDISKHQNCYLRGYWQSAKYFQKYEDDLGKEFSFKSELKGKNKILSRLIMAVNPVSVHIRRGDYVTNKKTKLFHGICDVDYYRKAMQLLKKKIPNPFFIFFSDDPHWVKLNLSCKDNCFYVDWNNGKKSYLDMQLMSMCNHNIIANSSFSWWGAWLNDNPRKIIITPRQWFRDASSNSSGLIPQQWLKI